MGRSFLGGRKSSTCNQGEECISEKAKAVLHYLRRKGPPLSAKQLDYCNEACIGRLLKAKGNHVKKAAKQLRATLAWRASLDVDYLTADEFSAELAWGNAYVAGQDEEGRPVLVVRLKPENVTSQAQKQFIRYFVFTMEVAIACMLSTVEQCVLILDAADCHKRGSPGFSTIIQLLKVLGEHYPERLARSFIVDAPAMFYYLWKGISKVLDLKVREKPRFVFSKKYNSAEAEKKSLPASAAANHLMRAARSYSGRNLWGGDEQLSDEEEEEDQDDDKFELRMPSMPRAMRPQPPLAVSCNPRFVHNISSSSAYTLSSLSSLLSASSLSPSWTPLSSSSPSSSSALASSTLLTSSSSSLSISSSLSSSSLPSSSSTSSSSSCSSSAPSSTCTSSAPNSLSPSTMTPPTSMSSPRTSMSLASSSLPTTSSSLLLSSALSSLLCSSSSSSSSWLSSTTSSSSSSSSSSSWSSSTTSSSSSSSTSSSLSSSCYHPGANAVLRSDKVHARSLSFASVPTCKKEPVSEFRSFRVDTEPSRRFNEDGVSRRWADLSLGPRNEDPLPHHHHHIEYAHKHKSVTLFRPYYTNFLIPRYNEAAYRARMKPPLAGLISIISPDLKYRQPSFSLHSTAMEAMLQHLHFD